jgi:hypothetical protein
MSFGLPQMADPGDTSCSLHADFVGSTALDLMGTSPRRYKNWHGFRRAKHPYGAADPAFCLCLYSLHSLLCVL